MDVVINTVTAITVYAHCCRNVLRESGNPTKFSLATIVRNVGGKETGKKKNRRDDNDDCAAAAANGKYVKMLRYIITIIRP